MSEAISLVEALRVRQHDTPPHTTTQHTNKQKNKPSPQLPLSPLVADTFKLERKTEGIKITEGNFCSMKKRTCAHVWVRRQESCMPPTILLYPAQSLLPVLNGRGRRRGRGREYWLKLN